MEIALYQPIYLLTWLLIPVIWVLFWKFDRKHLGYKLLIGGVRTSLILVFGLTLASPRMLENSDKVNLFYLIDESDSIGFDQKERTIEWVRRIEKLATEEDRTGLIVFGKNPSLEYPLQTNLSFQNIRSQVNSNFSNLYNAMRLAIGQFPQVGKNRILLFSDGNQNIHEGIEMAHLAQSLGIEIFTIPLSGWFEKNEVFVEKLETPQYSVLETPFQVRVVINSTNTNESDLIIMKNGSLLVNETVSIKPGKNVFTFVDSLNEQGLFLYKTILNSPSDTAFQNNEGISFTQGTKKAEVLYLADPKRSNIPLIGALRQQGLDIQRKRIENIPKELYQLINYNAIIFDNVSGVDLPYSTMENIEKYVKHMGGGFIMIGGNSSFGAGHYLKTPIENVLPVYMDSSKMEVPTLTLVLIIDKSSSMASLLEPKSDTELNILSPVAMTKLEIATIATFSSVEILNPFDKVGIIAFNGEFEWVVPITHAGNQRAIAKKLSTLLPLGGTNLYPGLRDAFYKFEEIDAVKKHIIILSDGVTKEENFKKLVKRITDSKITISTVLIGDEHSDDDGSLLMKNIAKWGDGRAYRTTDPTQIPKIFVSEAKLVVKELINEKELQPQMKLSNDMVSGISMNNLPSIQGLIDTFPKPGAQVIIETNESPLLVSWQYGLGRSIAFTSDLSGKWSKEWVKWNQFSQFVSQMVKWARKNEAPQNYDMSVQKHEDIATFKVDVTTLQDQFINHLKLTIQILSPDNSNLIIPLDQIAPGQYSGNFPVSEVGEYFITLTLVDKERAIPIQTMGFGIPYTDEFQTHTTNISLLDKIAKITKGKRLDPSNLPDDLFINATPETTLWGKPLWPNFAILSLFLLVIDVALRKVASFYL